MKTKSTKGFAGWPNAVGNYNNICANTTEVKYNCPEMNQEFGHHTIDQIDGVFTWEECGEQMFKALNDFHSFSCNLPCHVRLPVLDTGQPGRTQPPL